MDDYTLDLSYVNCVSDAKAMTLSLRNLTIFSQINKNRKQMKNKLQAHSKALGMEFSTPYFPLVLLH